jgi:predicted nucleotidyltransferase
MLNQWRKFRGWVVLEYFLKSNERIHIKGLSKILKISPRTAQTYLRLYEKNKILRKENVGNITLYSLNENPVTFEFKKLYSVIRFIPFIDEFVEKNPEINSVALYGSHAGGMDDRKSDIDILVISQSKKINLEPLKKIERNFEKEVKIQIFSIGEWKSLLNKSDPFALSVLKKHILLYGASL